MYHAWYSESQEKTLNEEGRTANFYLTESGEEVRITEVRDVNSGDQPTSLQSDLKYLGIVVKLVRPAEPIIDIDAFNQAKEYRNQLEREEMRSYYNRREEKLLSDYHFKG